MKKILLCGIIFGLVVNGWCYATYKADVRFADKWHKAVVYAVVNKAKDSIEFQEGSKKELIRPGSSSLKIPFTIPFASMKDFMKEIHNDIAYIPAVALRISTSLGTFGLWEDERGLQMCKIETFPLYDTYAECVYDKNRLFQGAKLTLMINASGIPSIC
jgi:hypothetical protein